MQKITSVNSSVGMGRAGAAGGPRASARSMGHVGQAKPGVFAALHAGGSGFRLVIADKSSGNWRIVESRLLAENELDSVGAVCSRHGAGALIRVIPAAGTIARCVDVPVGESSQMSAAANLLAEAELPSMVAPHRRSGGLIPEVPRTGLRTALLTGWISRGEEPEPLSHGLPELWCSPLAALAMLRGAGGRVAAYVDSAAGEVCVLAAGAEKSVARVSLDDAEQNGTFMRAAGAMITETAAAVGCSAEGALSGGGARVMLERTSRAAVGALVSGSRDEPAWFDDYGIALGAILAAGDSYAAGLARMLAREPIIEEALPVKTARWLSTGARSWVIAAAAVLCLLVVPWGIAAMRDSMLGRRTKVLEEMKSDKAAVEEKAGLYAQLEVSRLPLTKLLADISAATPVGVVATDLQLNPEQGLTFQGTAEKQELVNEFQSQLAATRLFKEVKINRSSSNSDGGVDFNLSAEISKAQAHVPVLKPADDFSVKNLAVRLYGEDGKAGGGEGAGAAGDSGKKGAREGRRGDSKGPPPKDESADTNRKPSASDVIPPVVSDDDIKKMDKATATKEWIARKVYVQKNPTLDPSIKQRLQEEESKIRTHAQTAPAAPATGDKPK